ncbi:hypothetical protein C479_04167 [Halovivax asiaticus JCM 14624]|uniref:Uncharacterized protein n=1 Tax=Halovivax asiaticus JCM 14624 TaxID=1227490 RepID=M0BNY6_9EURY|nr:hypothetical protein [Halovivax asiaticus]ELZ12560.1 hypothetical protein C479_04167 [Halovivax asiaticus JCM 14624]
MTTIDYSGTELRIDGETTITLRHRIEETLEVGDKILVLLYPGEGNHDRRNVLAFDTTGEKCWESEIPENDDRHMFAGIRARDGEAIGWSWNKHEYRIDLDTGALTDLGRSGK